MDDLIAGTPFTAIEGWDQILGIRLHTADGAGAYYVTEELLPVLPDRRGLAGAEQHDAIFLYGKSPLGVLIRLVDRIEDRGDGVPVEAVSTVDILTTAPFTLPASGDSSQVIVAASASGVATPGLVTNIAAPMRS